MTTLTNTKIYADAIRAIFRAAAGAMLLMAMAVTGAHASVTIGEPADAATGNCFPFGCSDTQLGPSTRYQQVYDAALFSGPISIAGITFFNTEVLPSAARIHEANYELHLSTTSKAVNGLDTTVFDDNVGADDVLVFSAVLSGVPGNEFHIDLTTPFNYDPADGNLLLDIFKSGFSPLSIASAATLGFAFLDARNGTFGDASSRAHDFGTDFEGWGLVTRFDPTDGGGGVIETPVPAPLVLLGLGMLALAARRGRRRR